MAETTNYKDKCDVCGKLNLQKYIKVYGPNRNAEFWCLDCVANRGKLYKDE